MKTTAITEMYDDENTLRVFFVNTITKHRSVTIDSQGWCLITNVFTDKEMFNQHLDFLRTSINCYELEVL